MLQYSLHPLQSVPHSLQASLSPDPPGNIELRAVCQGGGQCSPVEFDFRIFCLYDSRVTNCSVLAQSRLKRLVDSIVLPPCVGYEVMVLFLGGMVQQFSSTACVLRGHYEAV